MKETNTMNNLSSPFEGEGKNKNILSFELTHIEKMILLDYINSQIKIHHFCSFQEAIEKVNWEIILTNILEKRLLVLNTDSSVIQFNSYPTVLKEKLQISAANYLLSLQDNEEEDDFHFSERLTTQITVTLQSELPKDSYLELREKNRIILAELQNSSAELKARYDDLISHQSSSQILPIAQPLDNYLSAFGKFKIINFYFYFSVLFIFLSFFFLLKWIVNKIYSLFRTFCRSLRVIIPWFR